MAAFEKEYKEFALQDLFEKHVAEDERSARALAKAAALHPNAIQNLRSGKNIKPITGIPLSGDALMESRLHGSLNL